MSLASVNLGIPFLMLNHLLIWISLLLSWKKINFSISVADHLLADLLFIELSRDRSIIFFELDFVDAYCRRKTSPITLDSFETICIQLFPQHSIETSGNQLFSWLQIGIISIAGNCFLVNVWKLTVVGLLFY
ncbi:hypothetical protein BLOT_011264 [Blomia tropicalis]|nr:hypothetical protein BLOT_011264 [Blomia tropicalis]